MWVFWRREIKWNVYWHLQALWEFERRNGKIYELCKCLKCGYEHRVNRSLLLLKRSWCRKCSHLKHWMSYNRLYDTYKHMRQRCENPKSKAYYLYWGRWIKCLWRTFKDFQNDMWEWFIEHMNKYWAKNTSIDRIDPNGNYCKENCRRATNKEQANNKRTTKWIRMFTEEVWLPIWTVNYWYYEKWLTLDEIREKFK